jgi:hypothetical protein
VSERQAWLASLLEVMGAGRWVFAWCRCGHPWIVLTTRDRDYATVVDEMRAEPCSDCLLEELEAL